MGCAQSAYRCGAGDPINWGESNAKFEGNLFSLARQLTSSARKVTKMDGSLEEPRLPVSLWGKARKIVLGRARDVRDPSLHHKISLIAFFAWVGLGADGLSSSAYGPEEAFKALGEHTYLAVLLVLATAFTVFVFSYAYSRIIEHFPTGGGGYVVATKLLGRHAGVVSGCALIVDYVLTITVSIAGGGDAVFSLLPAHWAWLKLPVEFGAIMFLILLNLRGVKESVTLLVPVFLTFVITHAIVIFGVILAHFFELPAIASEVGQDFQHGFSSLGAMGMLILFLRAFSLGGGTYTGIEAVSNGVAVLRDPKVQTGKRTMLYMALSLMLTAGGILVCYMIMGIRHVEGETLNATLIRSFAERFYIGSLPVGLWFVSITMFSEALLLLVAAQTGFIDGPRVMANMAADSWLPRRFASLSDRMTMQNGILLIGLSAIALLIYTRGHIGILVVMYSMNVFLTFLLSESGMVRFWFSSRKSEPLWKRNIAIHGIGWILSLTILGVMAYEKLREGAWITVLITGTFIALCLLIRAHYRKVSREVLEVRKIFSRMINVLEEEHVGAVAEIIPGRTAAILVSDYSGVGMHLFFNVLRLFPKHFTKVVFLSVGKVDTEFFKHEGHVSALEERTINALQHYVELSKKLGIPATSAYALGTDVVAEASNLCLRIAEENPGTIFFAGEMLFRKPAWYHRLLHNETSYAIQRQIRFAGLSMLILPLLLNTGEGKNHAAASGT